MGLSTGETDIVNPGYGGFGGFGNGLGGFGLVGLIGLNSFLGRDGFGRGDDRGGAGNVVLEQNVSNIREEIGALGNELQAAFSLQTASQTGQFNNLGDLIMNGFSQSALAAKDATIQGILNTQSIKDQAAAFQVVNQENFCDLKSVVHAEGDATRALINQIETQNLRDRILELTRAGDRREFEINISNSNQQTQNQLQAQSQAIGNALNALQAQIAHQTNSLINVGSGTVTGAAQTATAANTKVNS